MTEAEKWAAYSKRIADQNKDVVQSSEQLADFLPVVGDARSIGRARDAYRAGDYGTAATEIGTTALGYTPLGPLAKAAGRTRLGADAIGAARAIGAGDIDFLKGWGGAERTKGVGADVVRGGTKTAGDERAAYMQKVRQQLKEESGPEYDVMFHSSPQQRLDADNFRYRPVNIPTKGSHGKGPGIFTHGYDQDYDNVFGDNVYAVVYDKRKPTYSGKMDDVSGIDETFIPQDQVGEMVRVWGGGKPVGFNKGGGIPDLDDPTNRDSVPAMLTPGEFVLNKEATQMYGPIIEQMNNHGLQARHEGNKEHMNIGGKISKLHDEGYDAPGQAYAIAKSMGYNSGGGVLSRDEFMQRLIPAAQKEGERLGIDPRIIMAQAIQETGWGQHVKGNNYFGIKSHGSDDGKNVDFTTHEVIDGKKVKIKDSFKGYDSLEDSVKGYGDFLQANPRYQDMLNAPTYEEQLAALGKSGYATDPNYAKNIGNIAGGKTFRSYYDNPTPAAPPEELAPPPDPRATSPRPQLRPGSVPPEEVMPQEEVIDVSPRAEAAEQTSLNMFQDPVGAGMEAMGIPTEPVGFAQQLLGGLFGGGGGGAPSAGVGGMQQAKSAEEIRAMVRGPKQPQMFNVGGGVYIDPVVEFNQGGFLSRLFGGNDEPAQDPMAGYANYSQQDFLNEAENFNNPGAQLGGYEVPEMAQPAMPGMSEAMMPPAQPGGNVQNRGASMANHAGNRFLFEGPGERPFVPEIDTAPPVPGSDEALLQGSSQQTEALEQMTAKQQWDEIRDNRNALPKGSPERAALSNEMNAINVADPAMDPRVGITGAATGFDPSLVPPAPEGPGTGLEGHSEDALISMANEGDEAAVAEIQRRNDLVNEVDVARGDGGVTESLGPQVYSEAAQLGVPDPMTGAPPQIGGPITDVQSSHEKAMHMLNNPNASEQEIAFANDVLAAPDQPVPVSNLEDPDANDPRAQAEFDSGSRGTPVAEKRAGAESVLNEIPEEEMPSGDEITAAEARGAQAPPQQVEKAKGILEENFGGLFDKKELARAAVLFAGAMLTGASPQKALAIAGQQYLGRLDAKEAARVKTAEQAQKAAAKGKPVIDMTQSEEFIVDGRKVKGFKMTKTLPDGTKITDYVDQSGEPLSTTRHQNFDQTPGTPEYNKRVQDESKSYSGMIDEWKEANKSDEYGYSTDILPKTAGADVAKWAIKNGVPPEAMGSLINNAMSEAGQAGKQGQKAKNIEAYLNSQYIQAEVGDPTLFGDAPADEVVSLVKNFANAAGIQGSSVSQSTPVVQAAMAEWDKLSPEEQARWQSRAKGGKKSAFMLFMEDDLNSVGGLV